MSDKRERRRMDFTTSYDREKNIFRLIPDPKRYEWKEKDGKRYLYDKFDKVAFSEKAYYDLVKQMKGKKIYFQPQKINNAKQYVKSRIPIIQTMLKGAEATVTLRDKSEAFLESLKANKLGFVIMCVDIVESTKLSINLKMEKYNRLISTVLYEMSEIVSKFRGHVLKYTGDGLIAYFPEPSFITKNDLALDCALTIKRLVYTTLNYVLKDNGYPPINIRIGIDSGDASVVTIGSPETKRQKDIIGSVVSLAAKIQSLGNPGDILIGDVTERNLHTMWRKLCKEVKPNKDWPYKSKDGKLYKVYKVKFRYTLTSNDNK